MKKYAIGLFTSFFILFTVFPIILPQKAAASTIYADGEYSIPFSVLKDTGNELSATAEYVVSPAKLVVQNGKPHIIMTLNNSSWWQYFKVQSGSGFADVQVLSEDSGNDKRVVKFAVTDVEQLVKAKIHVIVTGIPGFTYDNKYDIRFKFSSSGIPAAPVVEKPATPPVTKPVTQPVTKPAAKPTTQPSSTPKAAAPATQKPAEVKEEKKEEKKVEVASNSKESKTEPVGKEKEDDVGEDSTDGNLTDIEKEQKDEGIEEMETDATEQDEISNKEDEEKEVEASTEQLVEETASVTEDNSKSTTFWIIGILLLVVIGGLIFIMNRKKVQNKQ